MFLGLGGWLHCTLHRETLPQFLSKSLSLSELPFSGQLPAPTMFLQAFTLHFSSSRPALLRMLSRFSRVRLCNSMDCSPTRLLYPWDSPGRNTGMGYHALLWGIFLTQGSNPSLLCLLHWPNSFFPVVVIIIRLHYLIIGLIINFIQIYNHVSSIFQIFLIIITIRNIINIMTQYISTGICMTLRTVYVGLLWLGLHFDFERQ